MNGTVSVHLLTKTIPLLTTTADAKSYLASALRPRQGKINKADVLFQIILVNIFNRYFSQQTQRAVIPCFEPITAVHRYLRKGTDIK